MAKLTVDFPSMPEGIDIEVPPYGMFKNKSENEVPSLEADLTVPVPTPPPPVEEKLAEPTPIEPEVPVEEKIEEPTLVEPEVPKKGGK